jgi:hypothetical protein
MDHVDELIVGPAKEGDWDRLIDFLERGYEPTPEMCKVIVRVLRGDIPRKPRPKKGEQGYARDDVTDRDITIALFVEAQGKVRGRIKKAMDEYKVERDVVNRALKKYRGRFPVSFLQEPKRISIVGGLAHGRCVYCAPAAKELEKFRNATCPHCRCPRGFLAVPSSA